MKEIKFSVVIPCYNGAKYIEECLASLSNQTYKNFEVIFIDDNSSDGSFDLALELKQKLFLEGEFLKKSSKQKKGVSTSRNIGISEARGSWVVFLDCDDYFLNHKLEVLDDHITNNPDLHAIHHAYEQFDDDSGQKTVVQINNSINHDFDFLILDNPIGTSTVAAKRTVLLDTGGFNQKLQGIEDYFLWCRIANIYGNWSYIPQVLTKYRFVADSLMSRRKLTYYVGQTEGFYQEAIASGEFTDEQIHNIYHSCFFNQLNYRIDISLNYYGISDFLKGLLLLIKYKKTNVAFFHLKQRIKNRTLYNVSKIVEKAGLMKVKNS